MSVKRVFYILLFICHLSALQAAQSIDSLFAKMPAPICPLLERDNKLDLIDLYNGHREAVVDNALGEQTRLLKKSADYLSLQLTASSRWEIKLFPTANRTLVLLCRTYVTPPYEESQLDWFDDQWNRQPVPAGFAVPAATSFAIASDSLRQAISKWPAHFIKATLRPDTAVVSFTLSPVASSSELEKKTRPLLRPISLVWDASKAQFDNYSVQNASAPEEKRSENVKK